MRKIRKLIERGYTYKGFVYDQSIELEEDNMKVFHEVTDPEGKRVKFDWCPYAPLTEDFFALWVDLGCPDRIGIGPLNEEELKKILQTSKN
jgi:hypothetical protein